MSLCLSPEQQQIDEAAAAFLAERSPLARARALRDSRDPLGFSRPLWQEMAQLGWVGMTQPEQRGGAGLGMAELGVVLTQLGRCLAPEPFLSSAVLGAFALESGEAGTLADRLLPAVARGERLLALAWQEEPRFAPWRIATRAEPAGGGYRVAGDKRAVVDGHVADELLVVARVSGAGDAREGLVLLAVPGDAPGLRRSALHNVDGRNVARLALDAVEVPAERVVAGPDTCAPLLDDLLDRGSAALAAELLGLSLQAFERTLDYLRTREQFGAKIGSFQALQHRAGQMFCEIELARSLSRAALAALDADDPEASRLASAAKAKCAEVAVHVTGEAIQMHGGLGMTDEHDAGLFLKRARGGAVCLGDAAFHRDRFAGLSGF